jgi:hypothetical protein
MRAILSILTLCLFLFGCATTPQEVRSVWAQPAPPPANMPAPVGFTVTPTEAFSIALHSGIISPMHFYHIYADSGHYYVLDIFHGDSGRRAYGQGVRINGQTGAIEMR